MFANSPSVCIHSDIVRTSCLLFPFAFSPSPFMLDMSAPPIKPAHNIVITHHQRPATVLYVIRFSSPFNSVPTRSDVGKYSYRAPSCHCIHTDDDGCKNANGSPASCTFVQESICAPGPCAFPTPIYVFLHAYSRPRLCTSSH